MPYRKNWYREENVVPKPIRVKCEVEFYLEPSFGDKYADLEANSLLIEELLYDVFCEAKLSILNDKVVRKCQAVFVKSSEVDPIV